MSERAKNILAPFERSRAYMEDRIQSGIEANRKGFATLAFTDASGNVAAHRASSDPFGPGRSDAVHPHTAVFIRAYDHGLAAPCGHHAHGHRQLHQHGVPRNDSGSHRNRIVRNRRNHRRHGHIEKLGHSLIRAFSPKEASQTSPSLPSGLP